MSQDFIFRGTVSDLDPELHQLLERERIRQEQTIILIPSESAAPPAVEEAMGSKFGNIYAEGYPRESSRRQTEEQITDFEKEVALYRRYGDPRYYKGVEYADVLEALTRRRAAELFAANGVKPEEMYVNVQPLSGGPANSALYTALLEPGDTIMGLKLSHGGHLSHGAPVNRSGIVYNSVSYIVDPETEQLDYDAIEQMALQTQPKVIVAGFSAYPLIVDWQRFREIADKVGAHFHADIAHISGLVAAGVHPSPVGIADSVMTTTHKSLCGPRGAMLMTHRKDIGLKIDRAVFPGEQGGGHFNTIGALALALKLGRSDPFVQLQHRIVRNAGRLAEKLQAHGLRVVAGKSENHLLLIDCKSVKHPDTGLELEGDSAARILDVAGIVTNKNTIPGDRSALKPTGIRIGTVWISQLGFDDARIDKLADAIALLLNNSTPMEYPGRVRRRTSRAKVEPDALQKARDLVRELTNYTPEPLNPDDHTLRVRGKAARHFLNGALTSFVPGLKDGETQDTHLLTHGRDLPATVHRATAEKFYLRFTDAEAAVVAQEWLRDLSDGYMRIAADPYAKLPGYVVVEVRHNIEIPAPSTAADDAYAPHKPFFIGHDAHPPGGENLPAFQWDATLSDALKQTVLYDTHVEAGANMVNFSGYEMPVWYTSVGDEHAAVRESSALFDVSHMGIFTASGPQAEAFLDAVTTNDVTALRVGRSQYTYLLDTNGRVLDDLMIYRMGDQKYMLVVNAGNNDLDWAWLNAVNNGRVRIDPDRPCLKLPYKCDLKDIRAEGERVLLALQGPDSIGVLGKLGADETALRKMKWATQKQMTIGDYDLIVSRSGYTGERVAYELFARPDDAAKLWADLVANGAVQAGLAARDSTRTEAGLPLHGHELAGPHDIDPDTACFGQYVKLWKPFFIGRKAYIHTYETHENTIVRFRMDDKAVRRPVQDDPILDKRGKIVGMVTSCAIDSDGYLTGLALVPLSYRKTGTPLHIYQTSGGSRPLRQPKKVKLGAKMPKPDTATVITRFPRRKRKMK